MGLFDFLFKFLIRCCSFFFVNTCIVLAGSLVFRLMVNINRLEAQESEVRGYDRSLRTPKGKMIRRFYAG